MARTPPDRSSTVGLADVSLLRRAVEMLPEEHRPDAERALHQLVRGAKGGALASPSTDRVPADGASPAAHGQRAAQLGEEPSDRAETVDAARLVQILEAAHIGLWDWDLRTDRVHFSQEWKRQIGYEDHEVSDDFGEWQSRVHPDDLERCLASVQGFLVEPHADYGLEFRFRHRDGSYRWILAQASLTLDDRGRPVHMLGSHVDVTERRAAEEALRASEERLRLSTELAQVAVWEYDFSTDTMSRSRNHDALYGLPWQPVWRLETFTNATHPADREASNATILGSVAPGGPDEYAFDFRVVHPDRSVHWLAATGQVVQRDAEGRGVLVRGCLIDVTARKEAEAAALRSSEWVRLVFEQASDGILVISAENRLLEANPRACEMLGYSRDEMLGLGVADILTREERARLELEPVRMMAGEPHLAEWDHQRKDGSVFPAEVSARRLDDRTYLAIVRDLTPRRLAEQTMRAQLEMLQGLNDGARRLAESLDLDRVAAEVARVCVEEYGVRLAWIGRAEPEGGVALLGHYPERIAYPREVVVRWDDSPAGQGPTGRSIRSGRAVVLGDLSVPDSYTPWRGAALAEGFRTSASFPMISRDRPFGVLNLYSADGGFFDPSRVEFFQTFAHQAAAALENARLFRELQTEAELLERRVAERTAALESANSELNAFASSVAHDLRAPLRAMQGLSQALLEDYGDRFDATGRDYAERIVDAAERLDVLIQDLLAYSRIVRAELRLAPAPLARAVESAVQQLVSEIDAAGATVEVDGPMPWVMAHPQTLEQVVANLVGNAVKFVAPGVAPRVRVTAELRPPSVRLWVEDNGVGVAAEHRERVFGVFERLHTVEEYPGTGVGLAIVRKGVERMGGRVGVEGGTSGGSRFWFELEAAGEGP